MNNETCRAIAESTVFSTLLEMMCDGCKSAWNKNDGLYEQHVYTMWALQEIQVALEFAHDVHPLIIISNFQKRMERYADLSKNEMAKRIFIIGVETCDWIWSLISDEIEKHINAKRQFMEYAYKGDLKHE